MDSWDSLITTLRQWEWIGQLLARLAVGLLFVQSGSGKLFVTASRQKIVETLRAAKVPRPEINAVVVALIEFVFGACLFIGFLTPLSCFMLICVMIRSTGNYSCSLDKSPIAIRLAGRLLIST
jgi:putative oxidoreductase